MCSTSILYILYKMEPRDRCSCNKASLSRMSYACLRHRGMRFVNVSHILRRLGITVSALSLGLGVLAACSAEDASDDNAPSQQGEASCVSLCDAQAAGEGCGSDWAAACKGLCELEAEDCDAERAAYYECAQEAAWVCADAESLPELSDPSACSMEIGALTTCGSGGAGETSGMGSASEPNGVVDSCDGPGCPLGSCDEGLFWSEIPCSDVYEGPLDDGSPLCGQEDGEYCVNTDAGYWVVECAGGAGVSTGCASGCLASGTDYSCT